MFDSVVAHLPADSLIILFSILNIARSENQRWIRLRKAGIRDSNIIVGFFVDLIGFSSMIYYYTFLLALCIDTSIWATALLLIIVSFVGVLAFLIYRSVFGGDNPLVWAISTLAIIPLQILLFSEVTWFGWFA